MHDAARPLGTLPSTILLFAHLPSNPSEMANNLPEELWLEIAHRTMGYEALNSLSRCSSRLSRIARPILYRHVILSDEDRPYASSLVKNPLPAAIKLLRADSALASAVRRLDYLSAGQSSCPKSPHLVDAQMIKSLTHLERISFYGGVFVGVSTVTQKRVLEAIGGLKHLKTLKVDAVHFDLGLRNIPEGWARNLESICILGGDAAASLWTTLAPTSLSTLTTLDLGFDSDEPSFACIHLFQLHLPRLRSLSLAIWAFFGHYKSLFDFLLLHSPTLEELGLEYDPIDDMASEFYDNLEPDSLDLAVERFTAHREEMLNRLHTFRGSTSCVEIMVRANLACLSTTLSTLSFGAGGSIGAAQEKFSSLLDALESISTEKQQSLTQVRRVFIDMTAWSLDSPHVLKSILHRFAPLLPALEEWCGGLPAYSHDTLWLSHTHIDRIFSKFSPTMRTVCLPMFERKACRGDIPDCTPDECACNKRPSVFSGDVIALKMSKGGMERLERVYVHDIVLKVVKGWEISRKMLTDVPSGGVAPMIRLRELGEEEVPDEVGDRKSVV